MMETTPKYIKACLFIFYISHFYFSSYNESILCCEYINRRARWMDWMVSYFRWTLKDTTKAFTCSIFMCFRYTLSSREFCEKEKSQFYCLFDGSKLTETSRKLRSNNFKTSSLFIAASHEKIDFPSSSTTHAPQAVRLENCCVNQPLTYFAAGIVMTSHDEIICKVN
jgi:hypothetical protein